MIWNSITIDEIKSKKKYSLVGGPFGSDLSGIHYTEFGVPVIRGTNLPFNMKFCSEDFVFVSEEKANKLSSNTAHPGDIIFTQRGTLGQVGIVPENEFERYIISQSQMKLTIDITKADPLYVYYYFRTKECNYRIENLALSSGVPHINLGILKKFKIPYPPLAIQRKIVSILSPYDELIEINNQRIKLLEEMAEEIYKEWFVRMRFPGYESIRFFDAAGKVVSHGTVGALPEGWEYVTLGQEFNKIILGGTPSRVVEKYWKNGSIDWIQSGKLNDIRVMHGSEKITEEAVKNSATELMPPKTVLIAITGAILISLSEISLCANQSVIGIYDSKNLGQEYLYLEQKLNQHYYVSKMTGSAQQHINKEVIKNYKIVKPATDINIRFNKIAKPLFEEVEILLKKNDILKQTRDVLLPKLIGGKLSVEHLLDEDEHLSTAAEPEYAYGKD